MWGVWVLPVCRLLRDPGRWGCGGVQLRSGIVVSARSAVLIASAQGQLAGSRRRRRRPVRMSRPGMAKILRCRVAVVARCKSGHQHARGERVQQPLGDPALGLPIGPGPGGEHGVCAALGQRKDPRLRERRLLALVHPAPPEVLDVLRGVGHIQTRPVDRNQPPPRQPRAGRLRGGDRAGPAANNPATGSAPNRTRAWKIADFDGNR